MWQDPIVEEVRTIREAYAKQFAYDVETIYQDLKAQEARSGRTVVSVPPKRVGPVTPVSSGAGSSETA